MEISPSWYPLLALLSVWTFFWKAVALWFAAKNKQKYWFIGLFLALPLNDLGVIELVYLFKFAKKPLTKDEAMSWLPQNRKR